MAQTQANERQFSANAAHLVRTTQQIHVQLSQMADQKASILMGATFVIFTIAIGQSRGGETAPVPLLVLGLFAFFSAVLAVLAIVPATRSRATPTPNLLFFGSFTQLSEEEYVDRVMDLLSADEAIFRTMVRDIYQNGAVLQRKKYRLLGAAYRVFLVGLTVSFVTVIAQYAVHHGSATPPERSAPQLQR
jgi:hypothetical protein